MVAEVEMFSHNIPGCLDLEHFSYNTWMLFHETWRSSPTEGLSVFSYDISVSLLLQRNQRSSRLLPEI